MKIELSDQKLNSLLAGCNESLLSQRFHLLDLFFACLLCIIFTILVPVLEWPDALEHISRKLEQDTFYPFDVFSSLKEIHVPSLNNAYKVFADQYVYQPTTDYFLINLERLPFVLGVIILLKLLAQRAESALLMFCPPLIYSLAAPSQEVVAIVALLAAVAVSHKTVLGSVMLSVISMLIDRSMVPNAIFLCLYMVAFPFRVVLMDRKLILLMALVLFFITNFVSPLDLIKLDEFDSSFTFNLTSWDIMAASQSGENKLLALLSSTIGLYGWLSIRPFPFWIYYPVILFFFVAGFVKSKPSAQSFFISLFLLSYVVLWLMPSLGQARYYPLQTMTFWGMVISGTQVVKLSLLGFYIFVTLATAVGCFISFFNAI